VRTRLTLILYVPIVLVLLVLGMAYAGSVAQGKQQDVFLDRLRDASYLTIVARQSLETDDRSVVNADLHRYGEAYGISAAVLDAAGATWATNGLDAQTVDERRVALSGRRADLSTSFLPWRVNQIVVAEPVFDGGDLVGAVVTVTDASGLSRGIWVSWGVVLAAGVVLSMLAVVVADRTAVWVLRPVRAVDGAMDRISHGQLDARIPESAGPPELRQVIRRFNAMADRVEYLMGKQQEFVHNASHELRNPLSALMLRVDDLALMAPEEHPAEVGSVRAETVRMAHILDALLLLADDTRPEVDAAPVDVASLVSRRVDGWRLLAAGRAIDLDAPTAGESWAVVNTTVLECALDAVLDNALKFSPDDTAVEVAVEGSREGDEDMVEVTVRDHGPGVPEDQLARLTDRLWRSPGHGSVRGSGLGLAIASELLDSGGGEVRLVLPEGGGLLVRLRVPRERETT
jgi:signal transduction histidine kinase